MKKPFIIFIALICALSAYSQGLKPPDFYVQRELKAPQAVKDRLASLRKDIQARNLQYCRIHICCGDTYRKNHRCPENKP